MNFSLEQRALLDGFKVLAAETDINPLVDLLVADSMCLHSGYEQDQCFVS